MPTLSPSLITRRPDRSAGAPVIAGTRVPVRTLIEYLEAGHPLDRFLENYPSVTREHAITALQNARKALDPPAA